VRRPHYGSTANLGRQGCARPCARQFQGRCAPSRCQAQAFCRAVEGRQKLFADAGGASGDGVGGGRARSPAETESCARQPLHASGGQSGLVSHAHTAQKRTHTLSHAGRDTRKRKRTQHTDTPAHSAWSVLFSLPPPKFCRVKLRSGRVAVERLHRPLQSYVFQIDRVSASRDRATAGRNAEINSWRLHGSHGPYRDCSARACSVCFLFRSVCPCSYSQTYPIPCLFSQIRRWHHWRQLLAKSKYNH